MQALTALKSSAASRRMFLLALMLAWLKAMHLSIRRKRANMPNLVPGDAAQCPVSTMSVLFSGPSPRKEVEGGKGEITEEATCINKDFLPFLLAFVAGWYDVVCFKQYKCYANMCTGNTLNLFMNVGNAGLLQADVALMFAQIVNFSAGFSFFKYLNMKMNGQGSCTAVAPLIYGLFALADFYRKKFPESRWHMLLLAVAGGMVNSISAERAKLVTNMMTGHYQKLSGDIADYLAKGSWSSEQRSSASISIRLAATFCSGVVMGMVGWNAKRLACPAIAKRRFAIIGGLYAAILVLHELPVFFKRGEKKKSPELSHLLATLNDNPVVQVGASKSSDIKTDNLAASKRSDSKTENVAA